MISMVLSRSEGGRVVCESSRGASLDEALGVLVLSELAFGAELVSFSATSLSLATPVLDQVDRTVFSGEAAEMLPLLVVTALYCNGDRGLVERAVGAAWPVDCCGLFMRYGGPMVGGRARLLVAVLAAADVCDDADVEACVAAGMADTLAALELRRLYPGSSLAEILR